MTSTVTLTVSTPQYHASDFYRVVDACNKFDGNVDDMWKFCILQNSTPVGYLTAEFANQMDFGGTSFNVCQKMKRIHLNPALAPGDDGAEACKQQFIKLCQINRLHFDGCLDKWLSSESLNYHAIRWLDNPAAVFRIPTPLRGILGVATAGVHLNVYTMINHQPFMWVSQRSMTTTYPGMLDQIVAGAMDPEDGSDPWNTLEHEAWEEAGLVLDLHSRKITQDTVDVGIVRGPSRISFYDKKNRSAGAEQGHIEPGVRFVFNMEVSPRFVPTPGTDNAVGAFRLKSVDEVKKDLLRGKWKPNSALTTLDFLLRKHYIEDGGDGSIEKLKAALQRQLPMATR